MDNVSPDSPPPPHHYNAMAASVPEVDPLLLELFPGLLDGLLSGHVKLLHVLPRTILISYCNLFSMPRVFLDFVRSKSRKTN